MDEWFYLKDEQPHGPLTKDALLALFTSATLPTDTLVRRGDIPEWLPARNIPDFLPVSAVPLPAIHPPPLPVANLTIAPGTFQPSGPQVRPWVRYFARMFDIVPINIIIILLMFGLDNYIEVIGICGVCNLFYEAVLLSTWGTTPGKALFNVRVRGAQGQKLSFRQALSRAFFVWMKGLGFNIPLISLITTIAAYISLTRDGQTSWDMDGKYTVHHREIEPWRLIVLIVIPAALLAIMIAVLLILMLEALASF